MLADPHDKLRIVSNQVIKLGYSFVYGFAWGRSYSEIQPFGDFFLTVGQNNFDNKIPFLPSKPRVVLISIQNCKG